MKNQNNPQPQETKSLKAKVRIKAPLKHRLYYSKTVRIISLLLAVIIIYMLGVSSYIKYSSKPQIISIEAAAKESADCVIVLGCAVKGYTPSLMLADRLNTAIELYRTGVTKKIIMSGDHRTNDYNEVGVMKAYAVNRGVAAEDIYMDKEGYSTAESLLLAKNKFGCSKVIIITQKYHIYRAIYIANHIGLKAYGVAAKGDRYNGQFFRDIRELAARNKEFLNFYIGYNDQYNGEKISLHSGGNNTNDKDYYEIIKSLATADSN